MAETVFELDKASQAELIKALDYLRKEIPNPRTKRRILNKASQPVQDAARQLTPVWKGVTRSPESGLKNDVHYRYKAASRKTGKRAGKGKGVIVGEYKAGHLRQSIQVLSAVKLKRSSSGVIGPNRNGIGPKYGFARGNNPPSTDAYYAHMRYGNARAFRVRIMEAALRVSSPVVVRIIESEIDRELTKF